MRGRCVGLGDSFLWISADNTDLNVSTTRHGLTPKLPNDATKYLDGQGRVMGGAICGSKALVGDLLVPFLRTAGPALAPFNAWVLLKGLETLELRILAESASALELARWLQGHPSVARVHYPGLPSHPGHELARRQMRDFVHVDDVAWQEVRRQQHGPDPERTASVYERWLDIDGGLLHTTDPGTGEPTDPGGALDPGCPRRRDRRRHRRRHLDRAGLGDVREDPATARRAGGGAQFTEPGKMAGRGVAGSDCAGAAALSAQQSGAHESHSKSKEPEQDKKKILFAISVDFLTNETPKLTACQ